MVAKQNRGSQPATPITDPTMPDISIEINGETFRLCFDFAALALAKAELRKAGLQVNILQSLDFASLDVDTLPQLFFAAALHYQPELTWEQANSRVSLRTSVGIFSGLAAAYQAAMMEPSENPPTAAAGS